MSQEDEITCNDNVHNNVSFRNVCDNFTFRYNARLNYIPVLAEQDPGWQQLMLHIIRCIHVVFALELKIIEEWRIFILKIYVSLDTSSLTWNSSS